MIRFNEHLNLGKNRPKGIFYMKLLRSGIVIEEYCDHNLVVDTAFFQMARLVGNDVLGRTITKVGFGTNGNPPQVSDTALSSQYLREVSGYTFPEDGKVQINWVLPPSENNDMAIREFGLFTQDGTLFARVVRAHVIHKEPDLSIEGIWTISFV
jgi:hypothetical protein